MSTKMADADWELALEVFRACLPRRGAKAREPCYTPSFIPNGSFFEVPSFDFALTCPLANRGSHCLR
jgi:hypothetical protein